MNSIQQAWSRAESTEVKMEFDICFRGHLITARIDVYHPFNFTWDRLRKQAWLDAYYFELLGSRFQLDIMAEWENNLLLLCIQILLDSILLSFW